MQEIQRMTPKERHARQTEKYRQLIGITEEVVNSARKVLQQTRKARGKDLVAELTIDELRKEIPHYCELGDRVIDQARRRVLQGEQVPNAEKIRSEERRVGKESRSRVRAGQMRNGQTTLKT